MRLLDRFLNPLWHKIDGLEDAKKADVAAIICFNGGLRYAINDDLIKPFEQFCDTFDSPALLRNKGKITPLPVEIRERLIDEALLACLRSCCRSGLPGDVMQTLDPSLIPDLLACIAQEEIKYRRACETPEMMESLEYSKDPEEARVQLILTWMRILGINNAKFVYLVTTAFFQKKWADFTESMLTGMLIGCGRTELSERFARARAECAAFSAPRRAYMRYMVDRITERPSLQVMMNHAGADKRPGIEKRLRDIAGISDKKQLAEIAIHDPSEKVRRRAYELMGISPDEMVGKLIEGIRLKNPLQGAIALGIAYGWFAAPALRKLKHDPDPEIRSMALTVLSKIEEMYRFVPPPTEP